MDQKTLLFLLDGDRVLLGVKKSGFGNGRLVGIGGKIEKGETSLQATIREAEEEIKIIASNLSKRASLTFQFPHIPDRSWDQKVHVFTSTTWSGRPVETEEIKPVWTQIPKIPMNKMWDDAQYWLHAVLSGKKLTGKFIFDQNLKVQKCSLSILK